MTREDWCPTDEEKKTSSYDLNQTAIYMIFGFSIAVSIYYGLASYEAKRHFKDEIEGETAERNRSRQFFQANLLSGLLASMLVISMPYTNWPQTIEATLSVVLSLSQASALGWLDFPPEADIWSICATKLPDTITLGLTLYAIQQVQETFFKDNPGSKTAENPPLVLRNPWNLFLIFSVVNEVAMLAVFGICQRLYRVKSAVSRPKMGRGWSIRPWMPWLASWIPGWAGWLFCAVFCIFSVAGAAVGMTMAWWGCFPFSIALWTAPISILVGAVFSYFQTKRRLRDYKEAGRYSKKNDTTDVEGYESVSLQERTRDETGRINTEYGGAGMPDDDALVASSSVKRRII